MNSALSRRQVCEQTSRKLAGASLSNLRATIGLDGFVDEIISVVDKRHDEKRFDRVRTIHAFREKLLAAAGQSCNYELVVKQTKRGGNAPIMANALAKLGASVTCIGNLGFPQLHPAFEEFSRRAEVISIGEPCHTDALEFDDGKLMLGKISPLNEVTWDNLMSRVGRERLSQLMTASQIVGLVNWTMLPHVNEIWTKLQDEILVRDSRIKQTLFIDLADPEKRTADDIRGALTLLPQFEEKIDVILGLNLKESIAVSQVLGLTQSTNPESAIEETARAIRAKLNLSCVVIHPRRCAAVSTSDGRSATFAGPFVTDPMISTGAGDHFNAGFSLGFALGFDLEECLCTGVATSGFYVRTSNSPTAGELSEFIAKLPEPE